MSYVAATIPNLAPGEQGYQLTSEPGNGCYVAARWECQRLANQMLDCRWYVRQVTAQGEPVTDAQGHAVTGIAYEQLTVKDVITSGGVQVVQQQLLAVALGEPDAIFDVPDDIRDAIQAAALMSH